jgi:hypothetical protein
LCTSEQQQLEPVASKAQKASVCGKLLFTWQDSLYSSTGPSIEPEDMSAWPLRDEDAVAAKAQLLREAWESLEQPDGSGKPTKHVPLLHALFGAYGRRFLFGGICKITYGIGVFIAMGRSQSHQTPLTILSKLSKVHVAFFVWRITGEIY